MTGTQALKHRVWVAARAARENSFKALAAVRDPVYERQYSGTVYDYRPGSFRRSWLNWDLHEAASPGRAPRRVFCFWTGDNELSAARLGGLNSMRERIGQPVTLVTPDNLDEFVVPGAPLHPAYEGLSLNHRSDYLRAYFMHHHGGGYQDIKIPAGDWTPVFDQMDQDPTIWIAAYPERTSLWVGRYPGKLGRELRRRFATLPGGSACIARPGSQLTGEWLAEVSRRLDYYADMLASYPGGMWGRDPSYPVSWNRLNAQVLHPLSLKLHEHVLVTPQLRPESSGHR